MGEIVTSVAGVGDLPGDGVPDMALGFAPRPFSGAYNATGVIYSGADGTVITSEQLGSYNLPVISYFGIGDIDGDGTPDYARGFRETFWPFLSGFVDVISGATGQPIRRHNFSRPESFAVRPLGDFDQDGVADYLLYVTNYGSRLLMPPSTTIISGRTGDSLLRLVAQWPASAGDFDGDGTVDVAAWGAPPQDRVLTVYSGATGVSLGSRAFPSLAAPPASALGTRHTASIGDADGDGKSDLVARRTVIVSSRPDFTGGVAAGSVGMAQTQRVAGAAPGLGGQNYVVLGSLSGTRPGFVLGGQTVPLNLDGYTVVTATTPGLLTGGAGTLSAGGAFEARLDLPALPAAVAGLTLHHAFVVLGATTIDYVSRPVAFGLLP
ncbi:MAG: VCBS repeat-containing protein [Planctomycetota bacterium]